MVMLLVGVGSIFAAIALGVFTLISASIGRSGTAKVLESLDSVYSVGRAAPAEENLRQRLAPVISAMTPRGVTAWLQRWLDYAGNPASWPPERIMEMQGLGLLVFAFLGGAFAFIIGLGPTGFVVFVAGGAVFGFMAPFIIVYDLGVRRQQDIRRQLPDALDLLTLAVEAGLGFDAAMAQVAASMPGALSREFARMLHEMQMGQRRAEAMRALARRTTVSELRTIMTSLVQAGELGIPIANVLREQSREMRVKRRQKAEEVARKLPVKVIFPLVLCLFPGLFVIVIGPGLINILDAFR
ncbi:MAG TPA: type II secretion system F family protein [Candidatus Limnocylindrales bacterium]|nr:type II secretion system F family protein [Candidatus Limnocylindrales bacterium]